MLNTRVSPVVLLIFLVSFNIYAQSQTKLSGKVVDKNTSGSIPFAYVTLEGVALGTVTDGEGQFSIKIPSRYTYGTLSFSYVGYKTQKHKIQDLIKNGPLIIKMKEDIKILKEVVIVPKKQLSAKALLKKVIDQIPQNYSDQSVFLDGYYRETIRENGAFFKYTDAVVEYNYAPYLNKKYKWKDFAHPWTVSNGSLSPYNYYAGARLHRVHFEHKTLKEDQVHIIDSRASEDLSKTHMHANIEGGPLGILGRDRVKFQEAFLGKKKFKQFDFELGEVRDDQGNWLYVLRFHTSVSVSRLEKLNGKKVKQWRYANSNKLLKGKIYINQEDFAIVKFETSVPNEFKNYFCSYTDMAIKHFDYKLEASYKKLGDRYYLDKIRHEDEFIYRDSVNDVTTPYRAVSELQVTGVRTDEVEKFESDLVFDNYNANQLYDYPLVYNKKFWEDFESTLSTSSISTTIRYDMEAEKTLEKQFHDKHIRDETLTAPIALRKTKISTNHGDTREDNYAWLKDTKTPRSNTPVMDYIEAENKFAENYFIPLRGSQRDIFRELTSRVEKNFESLPTKRNGYEYYTTFSADEEYPVFYRKKEEKKEKELLMDVNKMADGKDYYNAGYIKVSPNSRIMAFYENTTGTDAWTLKFKDLNTGKMLADSILQSADMEWINNETILYVEQEKKTNRTYKVLRHKLGTPQKEDVTIFIETDKLFSVGIEKSRSRQFIFLNSSSSTTSEVRFLRVNQPFREFKLVSKREKGHLYHLTDFEDKFYIHSNKKALNFRVMLTDTAKFEQTDWTQFIPPRKDVLINGFLMFNNYTVTREKSNVQNQIRVMDRTTGKEHTIKFKEDIYNVQFGFNPDTNTDTLRLSYESMVTPLTTYNYHMGTKELVEIKKQQVPNMTFGVNKIKVERLWATAKDGTKIPITLMYRKWAKKMERPRLYLTSYGSYGSGMEIGFNHTAFSFTDRAFIYAIAHVRGGDDMGRQWYYDGKMLNKRNTFSDFIAVAEYLIDEGFAEKGNIVAEGGSAGGLLMGAIANMRPDLFKMIILEKPFVDVLNTMLDESLPLTISEYEEWGPPQLKKYYNYIKSYSPYDNVKQQEYPHMLFFTGLNDTRVGYWEPAKMVAKLREMKMDDNLLLLKTDLTSGHGGASGRYSYFRDLAYKLALIVDVYSNDLTDNAANAED